MPEASSILNGEAVSLRKTLVGGWDGDGSYSTITPLYGSVNLTMNVTAVNAQRYGDGGKLLASYARINGGTISIEWAGDMTSLSVMLGLDLVTTGVTPEAIRALRMYTRGLPYFGLIGGADLEDGTPLGVHLFAPKCQIIADTIQVLNIGGGEEAEFPTLTAEVTVLPDDNYQEGFLNEIQRMDVAGAGTTGTYTLSIGPHTTAGLAFNADAAAIQAALEALPIVGAGNVTVTADAPDFVIEFVNDLAATRLPLIVLAGAGGYDGTVTIVRTQSGDEGYELFASMYEVEQGYTLALPPLYEV